jgi:hypothetical protein
MVIAEPNMPALLAALVAGVVVIAAVPWISTVAL